MNYFINHFKKLDWILIVSSLMLVGIGLISLYSSSIGRNDFWNFQKEIIYLVIGFVLMIAFSFLDYRIFRNDSYLILAAYAFFLAVLAGLLLFAPEIRGVKSWYKIGPVSIDPIEGAKIVLIILLAKYFSMRHIEMYRIRHIFLSGIYVAIPCLLIFMQPNMGSVLILLSIWVGMLIISGIELRHFLILCLSFVLLFAFSWFFLLRDYQKERITNFIAPQIEPLGSGWNQTQTKIAIGSGGIFGKGSGKGPQTQYFFLPEPQTDFTFSAIAEEFGLAGISLLLILFSVFIWRIIKIGISSQTNFPRLFASGFAIALISQIFINIAMNLGLLPIIGIPMPLVSYGGSNLILVFIGLGILENIYSMQNY